MSWSMFDTSQTLLFVSSKKVVVYRVLFSSDQEVDLDLAADYLNISL